MKHRSIIFITVILTVILGSSAFGQVAVGNTSAGASIGLWYGVGFSASYESLFKELENLGILGWGIEAGYASDEESFGGLFGESYGWKYTYIPIFGFVSFHYPMKNPKLDPYARLGLGYVIVSAKETGTFDSSLYSASSSYLGIAGQVGIRYAMSPKVWLRAAAGTPWILSVGADINL